MYTTRTIGRATAIAAALALTAGSIVPATASPDPTSTAKQEEQSAPKVKKDRQICVQDTITGSRMPRKTCKTREEWIKQNGVDPLEDL